jgi:hypothetical protein
MKQRRLFVVAISLQDRQKKKRYGDQSFAMRGDAEGVAISFRCSAFSTGGGRFSTRFKDRLNPVGAELARDSGMSVEINSDWNTAIASKLGSHRDGSVGRIEIQLKHRVAFAELSFRSSIGTVASAELRFSSSTG